MRERDRGKTKAQRWRMRKRKEPKRGKGRGKSFARGVARARPRKRRKKRTRREGRKRTGTPPGGGGKRRMVKREGPAFCLRDRANLFQQGTGGVEERLGPLDVWGGLQRRPHGGKAPLEGHEERKKRRRERAGREHRGGTEGKQTGKGGGERKKRCFVSLDKAHSFLVPNSSFSSSSTVSSSSSPGSCTRAQLFLTKPTEARICLPRWRVGPGSHPQAVGKRNAFLPPFHLLRSSVFFLPSPRFVSPSVSTSPSPRACAQSRARRPHSLFFSRLRTQTPSLLRVRRIPSMVGLSFACDKRNQN